MSDLFLSIGIQTPPSLLAHAMIFLDRELRQRGCLSHSLPLFPFLFFPLKKWIFPSREGLFPQLNFFEIQLIYNVEFFCIQQSDSVLHIYIERERETQREDLTLTKQSDGTFFQEPA